MKCRWRHHAVFLLAASTMVTVSGYAATQWGVAERPVVVELFTSQGCSACPPADKLLRKLAQDDDIIALSLPVDYWDYLGWRDTLARPENAARQSLYAKRLAPHRRYTPQIVVDGRFNAVGNRTEEVMKAIRKAFKFDTAPVEITTEGNGDDLTVHVSGGMARDADVVVVCFDKERPVSITGGENEGLTIPYANVVTTMDMVGFWSGKPARFNVNRQSLTLSSESGCAVLVQELEAGPILGALRLEGP